MAPLLCIAMAAVALACLGCVPHLGMGPTLRTWYKMLGLSTMMVLLHLPMLLTGHVQHDSAGALHLAHVGHVGHGTETVSGYSPALAQTVITAIGSVALGLALVQIAIALSVLIRPCDQASQIDVQHRTCRGTPRRATSGG